MGGNIYEMCKVKYVNYFFSFVVDYNVFIFLKMFFRFCCYSV